MLARSQGLFIAIDPHRMFADLRSAENRVVTGLCPVLRELNWPAVLGWCCDSPPHNLDRHKASYGNPDSL